jgi:hypothetical protein
MYVSNPFLLLSFPLPSLPVPTVDGAIDVDVVVAVIVVVIEVVVDKDKENNQHDCVK